MAGGWEEKEEVEKTSSGSGLEEGRGAGARMSVSWWGAARQIKIKIPELVSEGATTTAPLQVLSSFLILPPFNAFLSSSSPSSHLPLCGYLVHFECLNMEKKKKQTSLQASIL